MTETQIDLCIAMDWEYDREFVDLLSCRAREAGLRILVVDPSNLQETLDRIEGRTLAVKILFDRASDTSPAFIPLQKALAARGTCLIDPIDRIRWASDKATLHLEFLSAGIPTPYTLILPPFHEEGEIALSTTDLACLGRPFVIKPATTTGGGIGVVEGAETLQDVLLTRQEFRYDKYLLQERIVPDEQEGRRYWFRAFYVFGELFFSWWDDRTHRYDPLIEADRERVGGAEMENLLLRIAEVARLSFFSTEIAKRKGGRWVIVDYVNISCDMRLQSRHFDGVPDELVDRIVSALVRGFFKIISCPPQGTSRPFS